MIQIRIFVHANERMTSAPEVYSAGRPGGLGTTWEDGYSGTDSTVTMVIAPPLGLSIPALDNATSRGGDLGDITDVL